MEGQEFCTENKFLAVWALDESFYKNLVFNLQINKNTADENQVSFFLSGDITPPCSQKLGVWVVPYPTAKKAAYFFHSSAIHF